MQKEVALLQLKNNPLYEKNLEKIEHYLNILPKDSLIVAPEVCLTDYDYQNLEKACEFGEYALNKLLNMVDEQILCFTLLLKENKNYVNKAVVLHKNKIIHSQNKHKLFKLGDEHKYLKAGNGKDIEVFEIDGVKYGVLICFELRYKELWSKLQEAQIILAPSQWGLPRKRHLEIIGQGLAVVNQCYCLIANSSKDTMASSSAVYSPLGGVVRNDFNELITTTIDLKEVKFMRRYLKLD
jgi:predicted amidohydrolase